MEGENVAGAQGANNVGTGAGMDNNGAGAAGQQGNAAGAQGAGAGTPGAGEGAKGVIQNGVTGNGTAGEKVVPDEYEFHLAEGLTIDDNMKSEFTAVAKELKLSQAEADKLVELHGNILMGMVKQHDEELEAWSEQCHAQGLDKEELLADAKYAVQQLGGGDAMKVLEESGAIYHPAVLKMLQFVGGAIREDRGTDGKPAANAGMKVADVIFAASKK